MGAQHGLHGLTAGLLVGCLAPSPAAAIGCGLVGCVSAGVPDTDHPQGTIPRLLGPIGKLLCHGVRALSTATTGTAHRGLSHSLAAAGFVGVVVLTVAWAWLDDLAVAAVLGLAGTAGVLAALTGDVITHAGLPSLFWPSQRRVRLPKWAAIRVGKWFERWVIAPLSTLIAVAAGAWLVTTWT